MKKQTWQKRNGSYIFHHFDARIDSPHKSLTPPFSPPPPPFPLLSLSLSLLTQPSLPLLLKMVHTPGLFSNYAPTFSEKVIIIRDPFSFFCEKHKIIFVIVVPERRSGTKIMARC